MAQGFWAKKWIPTLVGMKSVVQVASMARPTGSD